MYVRQYNGVDKQSDFNEYKLLDVSKIRQVALQYICGGACQTATQSHDSKHQSRDFEIWRDFGKQVHFPLVKQFQQVQVFSTNITI